MATRYWVGGSGTWNSTNTANWSTTSGGAGGASVPTSADVATFNASSGSSSAVVTVSGDVPCLNFSMSGFVGTIDCQTNSGYISTYNGSSTSGSSLNAQSTLNIYCRATGTTNYGYSLTNCTVLDFQKVGSSTAQISISKVNAAAGVLYIQNITTNTTGTFSVVAGTVVNSPIYGTGTWTFNNPVDIRGSQTYTGSGITHYGTINLLAASSANQYLIWHVNLNIVNVNGPTGALTISGINSSTIKSSVNQLNFTTGTLTLNSGSSNSFTDFGTINLNGTGATLTVTNTGTDGSYSYLRIANLNFSAGTLKLGNSTWQNLVTGSLQTLGSDTKTLSWISSSSKYITFTGSVTFGGTNLTNTTAVGINADTFYVSDGDKTLSCVLGPNVATTFLIKSLDTSNLTIGSLFPSYNTALDISTLSVGTMLENTSFNEGARGFIFAYNRSTQVTLNVTTWPANKYNYVDFYGINVTGTTLNAVGYQVGNCGKNSGITFNTPVTRYFVSGGTSRQWEESRWSTTSGGTVGASVPLVHDTAIFDVNSGGATITCTSNNRAVSTVSALNFSGTLVGGGGFGSRLFKPFEVAKTSGAWYLAATNGVSTNIKITTTNSAVIDCTSINQTSSDSVWQLSGNSIFNTLSLANYKTFNTNNYTLTTTTITINGSTCNGDFGTSTITNNGNCTFLNVGSGTVNLLSTSLVLSPAAYLTLSNGNIGKCYVSGASGASYYIDSNAYSSIGELASSVTGNTYTIKFQGTTPIYKWSISGTVGNKVSIRSISDGNVSYLQYLGAGAVSAEYLDIKDSNASPLSTWYAGTNSTNSGNNTGWNFTAPVFGNSLFFGSNF